MSHQQFANPEIQVVILTYQRVKLLQKCLDSVFQAIREIPGAVRVDVLVNGMCAETEKFLKNYSHLPKLHIQRLPEPFNPGKARNQIREHIVCPWICFLDDDVEVSETFFEDFLKISNDPSVGVWGGPNLTPKDSTFFQILSGHWLGSVWGAGGSAKRYQPVDLQTAGISALTLCNLFVRSELFLENPFPDDFVSAEEIIMLDLLEKKKVRFGHSKKIEVVHHRREGPREFFKQVYKYANGRGLCLRKGIGSFYHCVPTGFLLAIVARMAGFSALDPVFALYFILNFYFSGRAAVNLKSAKAFLISVLGFPMIHLMFGAGVLRGLLLRL